MTILVNGERQEVESSLTLSRLLHMLGYASSKVAVAINETFVPKTQYEETSITEGDHVDIVAPVQGG